MARVLITTVPFGGHNRLPLELLEGIGADYLINPIGRRLTEDELCDMIMDAEVVIAGTEPITDRVMGSAPNLRLISRVGVGLDSVDLSAADRRGIQVSYTPEAPAPAVADLAVGLILTLLRDVHIANARMHQGQWERHVGRRVPHVTIGVIGTGRIGTRVLRRLAAFGSPRVLVNDLNPRPKLVEELKLEWVDKETIYREADVISVHVPMTPHTRGMIGIDQLRMMKTDALLVNTARGGIVDEAALARALSEGHLGGVALDVFVEEPYSGALMEFERCLLTCHMGSMAVDCRTQMEIEATEEAVRFITGVPLVSQVPKDEYLNQLLSASESLRG